MRISPYLCLGGLEISNDARMTAYAQNVGVTGVVVSQGCACYVYDEGYDHPATDPAPWYEATRPESADFIGFIAFNTHLEPTAARTVTAAGRVGGYLGSPHPKARVVAVNGLMLAATPIGMAYGERWLSEALLGSDCTNGCAGDDLKFLPACAPESMYNAEESFRTLMNVGLIDGPVMAGLQDFPECSIQEVSFTLTAGLPWVYSAPTRCLELDSLATGQVCSLTTPEWMGHGTFRVELENTGTSNASNIVIQGQISLDGDCPVDAPGSSVPVTFYYIVNRLKPDDKIIIDGARRRIELWDASEKYFTSGLPFLDFSGPFRWPDVGPCTTMCLSITAAEGGFPDVMATVDTYLREF